MGVTKTQGIADVCEHVLSENSEIPGDVLMDKHMTHSSPCDVCPCDNSKTIIITMSSLNNPQYLCECFYYATGNTKFIFVATIRCICVVVYSNRKCHHTTFFFIACSVL